MKKCFAPVLVLLIALSMTAYAADDLKSLSVAQLLTLRSSIDAELMSRGEKESFTVPNGIYIAGEDFPAGTYKVTLDGDPALDFATMIIYASESKIAATDFINMYTISPSIGTPEIGKLKLEAGMAITLNGSPLLFTKYTGLKFN